MEFLNNFQLPKDGKHRYKKGRNFKGKGEISQACSFSRVNHTLKLSTETFSAKTVPRMRAKPKVYPTVQEPAVHETSSDRKILRRSNGVNSFPNVLFFRTAGNHNMNSRNRFHLQKKNKRKT